MFARAKKRHQGSEVLNTVSVGQYIRSFVANRRGIGKGVSVIGWYFQLRDF